MTTPKMEGRRISCLEKAAPGYEKCPEVCKNKEGYSCSVTEESLSPINLEFYCFKEFSSCIIYRNNLKNK